MQSRSSGVAHKETISDALWMSVLAGLGGVIIEAILLGGFYLFDPVGKMILVGHGPTGRPQLSGDLRSCIWSFASNGP
jgi:hypothetical protein